MGKSKKKSGAGRFLLFLNYLIAGALLLSYLAYYINPAFLSFFAFAGLAYPILLLGNLLFVLYWSLRLNKRVLLSLFCIALGYPQLIRTYRFGNAYKVAPQTERLKVMSYNVRMFNAYEWIGADDIPGEINKLLQSQRPGILLVQEYHKTADDPTLDYPYRFQPAGREGQAYSLLILSDYPIVHSGSYPYLEKKFSGEVEENNAFIFADVVWGGDTIRLINVHLASVGLLQNDYLRLKNPNAGSNEDIQRGFLTIFRRLHRAFVKRSNQLASVEKAIEESPHPIILCGDFNDTPYSYTYRRVNDHLKDAYLQAGEGFGNTYSRGPMPFRIDHIFHSPALRATQQRVIYRKLSDHYPVLAEFEWDK